MSEKAPEADIEPRHANVADVPISDILPKTTEVMGGEGRLVPDSQYVVRNLKLNAEA
jgi:hypothetical protein